MIAFSFSIFLLITSCVAQQQGSITKLLDPVVIEGEVNGTCPSAQVRDQARSDAKEKIRTLLMVPNCPCGGPGQWHRIAYLNMSDPNQQCPVNWRLVTTPVRACSRTAGSRACDSAIFPSNGQSYSRVCGKVNAYHKGNPDAFSSGTGSLEGVYVDGFSLTHGLAGSRQHIWTFASAIYESGSSTTRSNCACTNTNFNWPYQVPSFVGNNYFCDTGNPGPDSTSSSMVFTDDPLWDGEGCGPTSTCCQFNNPPWFCTTLPQPTTDDIELRNCGDASSTSNEDNYAFYIEIYVR